MSHFESTSGCEGALKAQTEPFPVLVSRARIFCELPPPARSCCPRPLHRPPPPQFDSFAAHIVVGLLDLQGAVAIGNITCQFVLINQLPTHCALNSASPQLPHANAFRLSSRHLLKRSHATFTPFFVRLPRSAHDDVFQRSMCYCRRHHHHLHFLQVHRHLHHHHSLTASASPLPPPQPPPPPPPSPSPPPVIVQT
jgi:hypothetical protein